MTAPVRWWADETPAVAAVLDHAAEGRYQPGNDLMRGAADAIRADNRTRALLCATSWLAMKAAMADIGAKK